MKTCDISGEGNVTLKFEDGLYFYECDTCLSDYADGELMNLNHKLRQTDQWDNWKPSRDIQ